MNFSPCPYRLSFHVLLTVGFVLAMLGITAGCGSNSSSQPPKFSGSTQVSVMLSSTANDQLQSFNIGLTSITLTNQSGKTVNLFSMPQGTQQWIEFIHINGGAEPLLSVSIPRGIYTAASVAVGDSAFSCVTLTPDGGLDTSTFAYGSNPNNAPPTTVTVDMPSPLTVSGDRMGLSLDLQVAQSATYSACYDPNGQYRYSIQPTFNLTAFAFPAQATNPENGRANHIEGEITALGTSGNSFTLTLPQEARMLVIQSDSSTAYQGISGFAALTAGTFVDLDGAVQSDGSLLASRIAVEDTSAVDVATGPVMIVSPGQPTVQEPSAFIYTRMSQGADQIPNAWAYGFQSATFQVSGEFNNLQTLPFVPSFTVSNVVAGQNTYVSVQQFSVPGYTYTPAATVTLMPQTINGSVVASSQAGNFTDYTVSLAAYDLFPALAVQAGQTTLLNNPSQVEVYVDSNTQKLNTTALAPGSTLRFYGLVFNDNGTLRMACAQVNDGVTASSQPPANNRLVVGLARTISGEGPGRQIAAVIIPSE